MTKQEFLNGKEFTVLTSIYAYHKDGYIIERAYCEGTLIINNYHCCVDNIGNKYFTYFNFVMGKKVSGEINFLEL
jgi:hypothetical protein